MLAEVRFGLKTGADKYFFVEDVTTEHLEKLPTATAFKARWGILPFQTDRVRIVRAGDRTDHLIEAEYLRPEVHSLMDITLPYIDQSATPKLVFFCSANEKQLRKSYASRYIAWGVREGIPQSTTVSARAKGRAWYDITNCVRPDIILPKIQQYRHVAPLNPERWTCNSSLLALTATVDVNALAAVLNSTWVGFWKWFYGRQLGNEANLQLDVYSAKTIPVLDLRNVDSAALNQLKSAFTALKDCTVRDLDEDLDSPHRKRLDDEFLHAAGILDPSERASLISRLYAEVSLLHGSMKAKEQRAMVNRSTTARRGAPSADSLAAEIWESLDPSAIRRIPEDFIGAEIKDAEAIILHDGKAVVRALPLMGKIDLEMGDHRAELFDEARALLALQAHESGRRGAVMIPRDAAACSAALRRCREYADQMRTELTERVAEKTANEKLAARTEALLLKRLGEFGNSEAPTP